MAIKDTSAVFLLRTRDAIRSKTGLLRAKNEMLERSNPFRSGLPFTEVGLYRLILVIGSLLVISLGNLHNFLQPTNLTLSPFRYALAGIMMLAVPLSFISRRAHKYLILFTYCIYFVICVWIVIIASLNQFDSPYWPAILVVLSLSSGVFTHNKPFLWFSGLFLVCAILAGLIWGTFELSVWGVIILMPVILFFNWIIVSSREAHSEKRIALASFPASSPTPMIEIGSQGEILYANEAAQRVFFRLLSLQDNHQLVKAVLPYYEEAKSTQVAHTIEIQIGARTYEVLFNYVPPSDSIRLYAADISDRIARQQALQAREEKFWIMLQGANEALILVDEENKITFVNDRFSQLIGYSAEEVMGKQFSTVLGSMPEDLDLEGLKPGEKQVFEVNYVRKDQTPLWALASISPYREKVSDEVKGYIVALTDIGTLKEVEGKLKERNEQMDLFLYKATHDLKGPLASVKGILNIALQDCVQAEIRQYIEMALTSTDRLDAALIDLLHVTRLNKAQLKLEPVDLPSLVGEILQSIDYMKDRRDVDVHTEVFGRTPFQTDRNSLRSVIQNLVTNAIKYKKEGDYQHQVKINIEPQDNEMLIEVTDNGEGIPQDIQSKIFQMFFRGNKKSHGTGLGLYIVKQSVDKLGGKMQLESVPGEGTSFRIFLPNPENLPGKVRRQKAAKL